MIIVNMCGGLGNQMFQYALYTAIKTSGKIACLDINGLDNFAQNHGWSNLFKVFDLTYDIADDASIITLADNRTDFLNRIRRNIFGRKNTHVLENQEGNFEPEILDMDNAYLEGYWQSEKYFHSIKDIICDIFQFKDIISYECLGALKMIEEADCAVSIHIRRGDYLRGINNKIYGNICNNTYYQNAIEYIKANEKKPTFFCFSNDIEFCKENFNNEDFIFVDCNSEYNAWMDMMLMTRCKHNIIANSSFSWWGAWLNGNQDKIVVAPKKWLNTKEMKDICPENWIRL